MNPPERIRARVKCTDELDLSDLIIEMIITSGTKNPYRLYFPKTDRAGVATLTREDMVGQFTDHWEAGVMDHDGSLETADSVVRVELYDPSWSLENRHAALAWALMKHERTKWSSREEQYRYRVSTRNLEYVAQPIEVDLHKTNEFVLLLGRRDRAVRLLV